MGGLNAKKIKKLKFHRIKTWILLLLLIPLTFADIVFLRYDHLKMTRLRDEVFAADEGGNPEEISTKLEALRHFTFSHIIINVTEENGLRRVYFGTGPFYLEQSYKRAAERAIEEAQKELDNSSDENPYGNIYTIAANTCDQEAKRNGWSSVNQKYINCMLEVINQFPSANELTDAIYAKVPSTELYHRNYASPAWTPCVTGFTILLTVLILLIIIIRFLIWVFLQFALFFI